MFFAVAKPGSTETSSQNPLESQTVSGPPTPVSAPPRACKSVADVIASRPNLQILQRAIKLAGLFTALSDKQQSITLFAPMDSAFLALSKSANQLPILTDPAALQSILGYHALSKAMEFDDLKSGKDVPTKVLENVSINCVPTLSSLQFFGAPRSVNVALNCPSSSLRLILT